MPLTKPHKSTYGFCLDVTLTLRSPSILAGLFRGLHPHQRASAQAGVREIMKDAIEAAYAFVVGPHRSTDNRPMHAVEVPSKPIEGTPTVH